jgi:DNA-binding CsgD family transcriptional regulator
MANQSATATDASENVEKTANRQAANSPTIPDATVAAYNDANLSAITNAQPQDPQPRLAESPSERDIETAEEQNATAEEQIANLSSAVPARNISDDELYNRLTASEKSVYRLILQSYSNQQMADTLYVSINTIKFHIKNIMEKAGVNKKSQLIGRLLFTEDDQRKNA